MGLRTGWSRKITGQPSSSFRDIMQMDPREASAVLDVAPSGRQRTLEVLGRIKSLACFPIAVLAYPYIRLRGYKGTYLYCLAKLSR